MDGLVKDMAVFASVYGEKDDYCQKPVLTATYRLGQFFNPFYAQEQQQ